MPTLPTSVRLPALLLSAADLGDLRAPVALVYRCY